MNILIKNGKLVSAEKTEYKEILIEGDIIKSVKDKFTSSELPSILEIIDASGRYIMPGLIDAHTHYNLVSRGTIAADKFYEGSVLQLMEVLQLLLILQIICQGKKLRREQYKEILMQRERWPLIGLSIR